MLLAPALWNGFPLLQYDTGGYLARWYEGYARREPLDRLRALSQSAHDVRDFWPAVVVQAAVTVWILALVLRVYGLGERRACCSSSSLRLSLFTTLPWLVDVLLTDIFAGLAVLALHVVVMHSDRLTRWERVALFAVIAFAAATHAATCCCCWRWSSPGFCVGLFRRALVSFAQLGTRCCALALSVVLLRRQLHAVAPACLDARRHRARIRPHAAGRHRDALSRRSLPRSRLRLCDHRAELPDDADVFFWGEGVFNRLGRFAGLDDEMRLIVLESLRDYPGLEFTSALADWAIQLVRLRDRLRGQQRDLAHLRHDREFCAPGFPDMKAARQQHGELAPVLEAINRVHVPVAWAAMVLLLGVPGSALLAALCRPRMARRDPDACDPCQQSGVRRAVGPARSLWSAPRLYGAPSPAHAAMAGRASSTTRTRAPDDVCACQAELW